MSLQANNKILSITVVFLSVLIGVAAAAIDVVTIQVQKFNQELDNEQVKVAQLAKDAMVAIAACDEPRFIAAINGLENISRSAGQVISSLESKELEMLKRMEELQAQLEALNKNQQFGGYDEQKKKSMEQSILQQSAMIAEVETLIREWTKFKQELDVEIERLIGMFEDDCPEPAEEPEDDKQVKTGQDPEIVDKKPAEVKPATGAMVVCFPCQEIANRLAQAKKNLADAEKKLQEIENDLKENQKQQTDIQQRLEQLQKDFDNQVGRGASGPDPDTGTQIQSRYREDGKIEVTKKHPDGRTETEVYDSKYMKRLKEQMDNLKKELEKLQSKAQELESQKSKTQEAIQNYKAEVERLQKELEDCIKKYCSQMQTATGLIQTGPVILISFDRGDCKFGGGTLVIPVGGPPQVVAPPTAGGTTPRPETGSPGTQPPGGTTTATPTSGETPQQGSSSTSTSTPSGSRPRTTSGLPTYGPTKERPKDDPKDEPKKEEPPQETVTVILIIKASETVLQEGATLTQNVPEAQLKVPGAEPSLPIAGTTKDDALGHDEDPTYPEKRPDGTLALKTGTAAKLLQKEVALDLSPQSGNILQFAADAGKSKPENYLNSELVPFLKHAFLLGNTWVIAVQYPASQAGKMQTLIGSLPKLLFSELNFCRIVLAPNDPFYSSKSTWKQNYDDQWAIKRVGLTADASAIWNARQAPKPVTVAVIDTGIDWNHQDISWQNLWQNPKEIPENGIDDDKNGYIDDIIGYDFYRRNNMPWDHSGHGTFVAGIIAATQNNGAGIAGINPHARIMGLKALNDFGHTRASYLAEAITYAANQGARIINVSVGGDNLTRTEQMAVDYAHSKGALVIAAAGNEAKDTSNFGPAGMNHVLTVAATDFNDKRAAYSNWGSQVDIAAPGNDVLSLRARRTDFMRDVREIKYEPGSAYVGADRRYYRSSGTSFSTPIVAGTASLLLSLFPDLTPGDLTNMLVQSAKDIDVPGRDQHTGYGLLDVKAAVSADPRFFVNTEITGVKVVTDGGEARVQVFGTADANQFQSAFLEIGAGENPTQWKKVSADITAPVRNGILGAIRASELRGSPQWTIRIVGRHENGRTLETRFSLKLQ